MNPTFAPSALAYMALAALYQHRSATTSQLHEMLCPNKDISYVRQQLRMLRKEELVEAVTLHQPRTALLHYLTDRGRSVAAELPEVSDRTSPLQNLADVTARILLPHSQAVLAAHLAFLADARRRGDDYGPLDWAPETMHRLSDRSKADAVRADALMRYTANRPDGRVHLRAFVEVDRATYGSEKLTGKLTAYARFWQLRPFQGAGRRPTIESSQAAPLWTEYYPKFPRLLFVLAGGSRRTMLNRIEDLQAAAGGHRRVVEMLQEVKAGAALLEEISPTKERPDLSPSSPAWVSLTDPDRPACGWMDL
ncbi:replication-relaxation family protein [Kitasatospora sp. NPDC002551]|uniref:replication-relaxation family protein n=1 Tax=Kitasatospora sp. NPDC002551 TaxID=3154539 RepID=UPI00332EB0F3